MRGRRALPSGRLDTQNGQLILARVLSGQTFFPEDGPMTRWLDTLRQDLRYALRMLRHSPAFTGAAILSLALGIGATTTMFSVIHAVVIEPFPYKDPDTLMSVIGRGAQRGRGMGSYYTIDQFVEIAE